MKTRNYASCAVALVAGTALTGCMSDPKFLAQAEPIIGGGYCLDVLKDTSTYGYNHIANAGITTGKAAMAIAKQGGMVVCGVASNAPGGVTNGRPMTFAGLNVSWDKVEQAAISNCEANKSKYAPTVTAPCRIFSKNHEVVWGNDAKDVK